MRTAVPQPMPAPTAKFNIDLVLDPDIRYGVLLRAAPGLAFGASLAHERAQMLKLGIVGDYPSAGV